VEIRPLRESDDRSRFRSGDDDLDRFLRRYAGQSQFRHHVGTTYVAVESGEIIGFATVAAGHLEIDRMPASLSRGLPSYPLPVIRLARLAVDERMRGRGIGNALVAYVLRLALRMRDDYGCVGAVVDAKPGAVSFYLKLGFRSIQVEKGASDAKPTPEAHFLPIAVVAAAVDLASKGSGQPPPAGDRR
jgi:GNAT superfamily N-acetyltransferase